MELNSICLINPNKLQYQQHNQDMGNRGNQCIFINQTNVISYSQLRDARIFQIETMATMHTSNYAMTYLSSGFPRRSFNRLPLIIAVQDQEPLTYIEVIDDTTDQKKKRKILQIYQIYEYQIQRLLRYVILSVNLQDKYLLSQNDILTFLQYQKNRSQYHILIHLRVDIKRLLKDDLSQDDKDKILDKIQQTIEANFPQIYQQYINDCQKQMYNCQQFNSKDQSQPNQQPLSLTNETFPSYLVNIPCNKVNYQKKIDNQQY